MSTHNTGSQLNTWATCQWAGSIRDFLACETVTGKGGWMDELLVLDTRYIENGHIAISETPGFGVDLNPDVVIVTGDHSTPSFLSNHSWHPVPTLLASDCCRFDQQSAFNESTCLNGGLGQFEAKHLMTLALANAKRLGKYGA